jgi:hypothetical protein
MLDRGWESRMVARSVVMTACNWASSMGQQLAVWMDGPSAGLKDRLLVGLMVTEKGRR